MSIDELIAELEIYKTILGGKTEVHIEVNNMTNEYINTSIYAVEPFNEFLYIGGK